MENTAATEAAQMHSGLINPGFKNKVTALQINPFVKFRGLECSASIEQAKGKALTREPPSAPGISTPSTRRLPLPAGREAVRRRTLQQGPGRAGRHHGRCRCQALAVRRRLVHHRRPAGEGRVRQPEILRVSRPPTSRTAASSRASCSKAWSPSRLSADEDHDDHSSENIRRARTRPPALRLRYGCRDVCGSDRLSCR